MKVVSNISELSKINKPLGIALGNFDGLHLGHQEVIQNLVEECRRNGLKSVVFTFITHPRDVLRGRKVLRLITNDQKIKLLKELNVDYVIMHPFDETVKNIEPTDFIVNHLLKNVEVKLITVGFDYRFGKGAVGEVELLREYSEKYGYALNILSPVKGLDSEFVKISSTLIRKLLSDGEVEKANKLLGRKYSVEGIVRSGKKLGREIGFPTANLNFSSEKHLLLEGVYITETTYDGVTYQSVTNVGYNPTFDQSDLVIETNIFDFDKEIYGEHIKVDFLSRVRGEVKFKSVEELAMNIDYDVNTAKDYFKGNKKIKEENNGSKI
jgi:riboflavin kinase/FMN adenylyltransferase